MAYVVAATVPIVLLELLIDDRTVRLIPLFSLSVWWARHCLREVAPSRTRITD
jgi:hypothetical protein